MQMAVTDGPDSREAVTNFTVLERFETDYYDDGYTLLECKLHTGRTHQIRVHMAHIDHRVVGDPMYGRKDRSGDMGLRRQFLHSYRLSLEHPISGEPMSFEDRLPPNLAGVVSQVSGRSEGPTEAGEAVGHILYGDGGARGSAGAEPS
jgi:23S rRNA pseudouridine1911/1915/1917 synthase